MAHLPEEEQLMLVLKEVEGLTVDEIGEVLDMNVNTVKVRMFRAHGEAGPAAARISHKRGREEGLT
jgi:DNA-directed RNA polymerase specialized sigma24 family protein